MDTSTATIRDLRNTFVVTTLTGRWPEKRPHLGEHYVRALRASIWKQIPHLPFICFTDREILGVQTRYLPPWCKKWWGKMYAFAASNFPLGSRVLVLDLDTAIVGPLDDILSVPLENPVFLRDAWHGKDLQTGMFSFETTTETARLWLELCNAPKTVLDGGDEKWLREQVGEYWAAWQDVLPGQVLSFKHDLHMNCGPLPESARVVYFDGDPRPHTQKADWNPLWVK